MIPAPSRRPIVRTRFQPACPRQCFIFLPHTGQGSLRPRFCFSNRSVVKAHLLKSFFFWLKVQTEKWVNILASDENLSSLKGNVQEHMAVFLRGDVGSENEYPYGTNNQRRAAAVGGAHRKERSEAPRCGEGVSTWHTNPRTLGGRVQEIRSSGLRAQIDRTEESPK